VTIGQLGHLSLEAPPFAPDMQIGGAQPNWYVADEDKPQGDDERVDPKPWNDMPEPFVPPVERREKRERLACLVRWPSLIPYEWGLDAKVR
jgi:hypothetical protein